MLVSLLIIYLRITNLQFVSSTNILGAALFDAGIPNTCIPTITIAILRFLQLIYKNCSKYEIK